MIEAIVCGIAAFICLVGIACLAWSIHHTNTLRKMRRDDDRRQLEAMRHLTAEVGRLTLCIEAARNH